MIMRVNIILGRIGNELSWDIRIKCNVPQKDNYNSDIRLSRVISEPLNQIRRGAQKNKNKQENATNVQKLIIIILNMLFILLISIRISQNTADRTLIKKQMILLSYIEQFSSLHKGHSWKPTWCYLLKALESKLKMSYLAQKDGRNFFIP